MTKIFIDGKAGTTGLRIEERLMARDDVTILSLPEEKRKDIALDVADAEYQLKKAQEAGKATESIQQKLTKAQEKLSACEANIADIKARIADIETEIDALRQANRNEPRFAEFETQRSTGIDLARLKYSEMRSLRAACL